MSALGASAGTVLAERVQAQDASAGPLLLFEKPVQAMGYDAMADRLAELGFDGIEATIRRGGHIEQADTAARVPAMMKSLAKAGLKQVVATTNVVEASAVTEDFLKILRDNGISLYRLGFIKYDRTQDLLTQARGWNDKFKQLAELNEKVGVSGVYQLHSGWHIASALSWDAAIMLEGIDPDILGLAFDPRHSRTDSGLSWKVSFDLLRKHTRALFIKDAKWVGERSDKLKNVSLDTGFVTQEVYDHVVKQLPAMPTSLHMEWGRAQIYPAEHLEEAWQHIARDIAVLKRWRGGE